MKDKRGQIAVFIILGLVIIIGIGVFLYLRSTTAPKQEAGVPTEVAPIKLYVDACLENTAKDAVLTVALQGGYYIAPENSFSFLNVNIPYYLYEGKVSVPTKEIIESELSSYIMLNLFSCINEGAFIEKGYNVTIDTPTIKTTIGAKKVFFDMDLPITTRIGNTEQKISKFSISIDANLLKLYSVALNYTNYQASDAYFFTISHAIDLSANNGMTFESFTFENSTTILSFIDNSILIKNRPLVYAFAIKYLPYNTSREELSNINLPPVNEGCVNGNETACGNGTI